MMTGPVLRIDDREVLRFAPLPNATAATRTDRRLMGDVPVDSPLQVKRRLLCGTLPRAVAMPPGGESQTNPSDDADTTRRQRDRFHLGLYAPA